MSHCDLCITNGRKRAAMCRVTGLGNLCVTHYQAAIACGHSPKLLDGNGIVCIWERELTHAETALLFEHGGDCVQAGIPCERHS